MRETKRLRDQFLLASNQLRDASNVLQKLLAAKSTDAEEISQVVRNFKMAQRNFCNAQISINTWRAQRRYAAIVIMERLTDYRASLKAKVPVKVPCPDCKGSGKYTSAIFVEDCQTCSGKGYIIVT